VTAAVLVRRRAASGLRRVDPRRDLVGLADLIDLAFGGGLDPSGRQMTRDMRAYGRLGWVGWLFGHLALPPAAYPEGYVWTESGRLVGNASLLPVEGAPFRWVLANVAVHPDFRRRGIARALVEACLRMARSGPAHEIVLQVKGGNPAAQSLYRSLGFADRGTRATWSRTGPGPGAARSADPARPRRPEEWEVHWALVQRLHPLGLVWPHPLRPGIFRPGGWPLGDPWSHWVWPAHGSIAAALSARREPGGVMHLFVVAAPEARGVAEVPLIEGALGDRGGRTTRVTVETGDEAHAQDLRALGFTEQHRLTWMVLGLGPGSSVASHGT
jgi:ribosomal protein S18 acetylase RimI-like enzyme